ncbi:hypothetical protein LCGC14_1338720 [marine sediment metagenome]|uniref:Uncharacterized protein n=1 Tax=marine sediment metagenome TaxID=412755 RepID=A0A0F9MV97_9ZZZZ
MKTSTRKHIKSCERCERTLLVAGRFYNEHLMAPPCVMKGYMKAIGEMVEACAEVSCHKK